jgi:hypothetical protein
LNSMGRLGHQGKSTLEWLAKIKSDAEQLLRAWCEVIVMAKAVNLPLRVYENLVEVSEELSLMAKKQVSPSMAVDLLMEIYRAHMNNPCALDAFSQQLANLNMMSPEEFDRYWDEPSQAQETKHKVKDKKH